MFAAYFQLVLYSSIPSVFSWEMPGWFCLGKLIYCLVHCSLFTKCLVGKFMYELLFFFRNNFFTLLFLLRCLTDTQNMLILLQVCVCCCSFTGLHLPWGFTYYIGAKLHIFHLQYLLIACLSYINMTCRGGLITWIFYGMLIFNVYVCVHSLIQCMDVCAVADDRSLLYPNNCVCMCVCGRGHPGRGTGAGVADWAASWGHHRKYQPTDAVHTHWHPGLPCCILLWVSLPFLFPPNPPSVVLFTEQWGECVMHLLTKSVKN